MRVAYAEIAPNHRPHISSRGPGVWEKLAPEEKDLIMVAANKEESKAHYLPPGIYPLENTLPLLLEIARKLHFQKIELRVTEIGENASPGAVICDFTPTARRAQRIQRSLERVTRRLPWLRSRYTDIEVGERTTNGVRLPISTTSSIYETNTRIAHNFSELRDEGPLITEVKRVYYLAE